MKLRIRDNSIRLRLTRTEVDVVRERGILRASLAFPSGQSLEYVLESSPASVAPTAEFEGGRVLIRLPESAVLEWAGSEQVGIVGEQPVDNEVTLKILVEKDFACLSPREDEDEADMFEHPEAGTRNCG